MHPDLAEYGPVRFHSDPNALYDRHLLFDYAIDPDLATPRERYEAVARSLRDVMALRRLRTKKNQINRRFLDRVRGQYPGDEAGVARMSLIEEAASRKVRMANLAIVGSHSTNGVAR